MVWILTPSIKMGIVTCGTILSLTANDEVFQGQLQDPGRKKGQSLLPKARGTGQDLTLKTGWYALVPITRRPAFSLSLYLSLTHTHTQL